jgi:hypothetical protein
MSGDEVNNVYKWNSVVSLKTCPELIIEYKLTTKMNMKKSIRSTK